MTKNKQVMEQYDLSSVRAIFTGAAPLGEETAEDLFRLYPHWLIRQGYGESSSLKSSYFILENSYSLGGIVLT
jgi:acyl-coenzyme A synthetase/AMP-(fatty) acid ligase